MNKVILMGRLTRDPDVRYSQGETPMAVARFALAVDRRFKRNGEEQSADFINCVAFGKQAEFVEKYFRKGMRATLAGHIQTGNYTNKEGQKVYTTDVAVDEIEFAESKGEASQGGYQAAPSMGGGSPSGDFMNIPDGIDEELPFN